MGKLGKLTRWAGSHGNWTQSDFGSLPAVQPEAAPMLKRWQVVAGGLALVLSRLSHTERATHFCASYRLYQVLRRRLRQGAMVDATSELLSDVMHEIAGVADAMTTQCLRACFDASLKHLQPRPSPRATLEWHDTTRTDLSQDHLSEHASALRSSIAVARGPHCTIAR